jgi:hypothetical protein
MSERYQFTVRITSLKRSLNHGVVRAVITAEEQDENGKMIPAAIFLCCVEPPDAFSHRMRESFITVASVEDLAAYPSAVSSIDEVDAAEHSEGALLYAVQENKVYKQSGGEWVAYIPERSEKMPNVHSHKLPYFRRSVIDIILPNRLFVNQAMESIRIGGERLELDQAAFAESSAVDASFYAGLTSSDSPDESEVQQLIQYTGTKGDKTILFGAGQGYVCFAYPEQWGALKDITNDSYSSFNDFALLSLSIDGMPYSVYVSKYSLDFDIGSADITFLFE